MNLMQEKYYIFREIDQLKIINYVYKVRCLGIKSDNSNFAWFGFNIIIDNSNYMTIVIDGYNR